MTKQKQQEVEKHFLNDVQTHVMTVIRSNGVDRHLRFWRPDSSVYGFELITWPGHLLVTGDCGSWLFARTRDMFQFFRMDRSDFNANPNGLSINPDYWAEKLLAVDSRGRYSNSGPQQFSEEVFEEIVKAEFESGTEEMDADVKVELWDEIKEDVLGAESEEDAHRRARDFKHSSGFEFSDFWEHNLRNWTRDYLWNLFAIVWGIQQFDKATASQQEAA